PPDSGLERSAPSGLVARARRGIPRRMVIRRNACAALLAVLLLSPALADERRDGQHDFDFEIGNWKTHLRRLQKPLTGSNLWVEYDGTSVVRKIWNGKANLVELDVEGPAGRIQGLSLRLYDPQSRQWSLHYANASGGGMGVPTVGEFKNGRGEFYDQESFN